MGSPGEQGEPRWVQLGIDGLEEAVEIGRGGFGVVYRARQPTLDRTVAVKMLTSQLDESGSARFGREGRAMGMLFGHPNIVSVLDTGISKSGHPYITMAYVPGGSLGGLLRRQGPMPWHDAVRVGVKLAGALETAHRRGTLHRDVKPDNVLLTDYGEPQLADFGIARMVGGFETLSGNITASLEHAAPEILDGKLPTVAADIYSLGSTIFTLMAGHPPFQRRPDEPLAAHYLRIASEAPPDLRQAGVPDSVCRAVERALAKEADERPRSCAELGTQLQDAERGEGRPPTDMALLDPVDAGPGPSPDESARTQSDRVARGAGPASVRPAPVARPGRRLSPRLAAAAAFVVVAVVAATAFRVLGPDGATTSAPTASETSTDVGRPTGCGLPDSFRDPVQAGLTATRGLALGPDDSVYVVDNDRHRVVRVSRNGAVAVVAGTGEAGFGGDGGAGVEAQLSDPQGLALDAEGALYIGDKGNNRVRRVGPDGLISTFAGSDRKGEGGDGGPGTASELSSPHGVAVAADGTFYVADTGNRSVRRIGTDGTITTLAAAARPPAPAASSGSGGGGGGGGRRRADAPTAATEALTNPYDVAVGPDGTVYVADRDTHRVYRVDGHGSAEPVAGTGSAGFGGDGGPATAAQLSSPHGIGVGPDGLLYIADRDNHRIRRLTGDGRLTTIAGSGTPGFSGDGGPAAEASLLSPRDVSVGADGSVFISDADNCRIRQVGPRGIISTRVR